MQSFGRVEKIFNNVLPTTLSAHNNFCSTACYSGAMVNLIICEILLSNYKVNKTYVLVSDYAVLCFWSVCCKCVKKGNVHWLLAMTTDDGDSAWFDWMFEQLL